MEKVYDIKGQLVFGLWFPDVKYLRPVNELFL